MVEEYIAAHVRATDAIRAKRRAAEDAHNAAQARLPENLRDVSDSSVNGPSGPVGYAWMAARGD